MRLLAKGAKVGIIEDVYLVLNIEYLKSIKKQANNKGLRLRI